jgi:predicted oxidoreductase
MNTVTLGASSLVASRLAYGCWRIAGTWNPAEATPASQAEGRRAVLAAVDAGYTLFDHADIYCDGLAETIFGQVLKDAPGLRQQLVLATKCGIRKPGEPAPADPYRYDFSARHILASCDDSLRRLGVDTIDIYQLHRPDWLCDPAEVADAFSRLKQAGKVREFGVSNFRPSQLAALQAACPMPLIVNQVEISLLQRACFEDGTLDQCLAQKICPMAWSPLAGGQLADGATKLLPSQEGYRPEKLLSVIDTMAAAKGLTRSVLALAWLLKHPAQIIPIIGSCNPTNIRAAARAVDVSLSREEWYLLLGAAGQRLA